jgi:hypothetical protein
VKSSTIYTDPRLVNAEAAEDADVSKAAYVRRTVDEILNTFRSSGGKSVLPPLGVTAPSRLGGGSLAPAPMPSSSGRNASTLKSPAPAPAPAPSSSRNPAVLADALAATKEATEEATRLARERSRAMRAGQSEGSEKEDIGDSRRGFTGDDDDDDDDDDEAPLIQQRGGN